MKRVLFVMLLLSMATVQLFSQQKAEGVAAQPDSVGYLVKVGDMAPDFTMELPDGTQVTLSSLRGKLVMLQFTASWGGGCR